jgi:hypothetical protein
MNRLDGVKSPILRGLFNQVNLVGHPLVLALTTADYAITWLLFILTSWIAGAGPRSANIMNYMRGVEFCRAIRSSLMHPASTDVPTENTEPP